MKKTSMKKIPITINMSNKEFVIQLIKIVLGVIVGTAIILLLANIHNDLVKLLNL
jgi:tryptophan synthase alpha subunit